MAVAIAGLILAALTVIALMPKWYRDYKEAKENRKAQLKRIARKLGELYVLTGSARDRRTCD